MNPPCARCKKTVYPMEKLSCLDKVGRGVVWSVMIASLGALPLRLTSHRGAGRPNLRERGNGSCCERARKNGSDLSAGRSLQGCSLPRSIKNVSLVPNLPPLPSPSLGLSSFPTGLLCALTRLSLFSSVSLSRLPSLPPSLSLHLTLSSTVSHLHCALS